MKDAWEAYFEGVERGVDGQAIPESPANVESDEFRAFVAAFEAAQMSTADFLVRDHQWSGGGAAWLTEEFRALHHTERAGMTSSWSAAAPPTGQSYPTNG